MAGKVTLRPPHEVGDDGVLRVIGRGHVARTLEAVFALPPLAWQHSRSRAFWQAARLASSALPDATRIRLIGGGLVVATLTHMAFHVALRDAAPPARTFVFWSVGFGSGLLMMLGRTHIAHAMHDRRSRSGRDQPHDPVR